MALCLQAFRFCEPFDFQLHKAGRLIDADVTLVWIVPSFTVVEARVASLFGCFGLNSKSPRQHLLHQQTGSNCFERVVHRLGHGFFAGIRLGDQVGEPARVLPGGLAWPGR